MRRKRTTGETNNRRNEQQGKRTTGETNKRGNEQKGNEHRKKQRKKQRKNKVKRRKTGLRYTPRRLPKLMFLHFFWRNRHKIEPRKKKRTQKKHKKRQIQRHTKKHKEKTEENTESRRPLVCYASFACFVPLRFFLSRHRVPTPTPSRLQHGCNFAGCFAWYPEIELQVRQESTSTC